MKHRAVVRVNTLFQASRKEFRSQSGNILARSFHSFVLLFVTLESGSSMGLIGELEED